MPSYVDTVAFVHCSELYSPGGQQRLHFYPGTLVHCACHCASQWFPYRWRNCEYSRLFSGSHFEKIKILREALVPVQHCRHQRFFIAGAFQAVHTSKMHYIQTKKFDNPKRRKFRIPSAQLCRCMQTPTTLSRSSLPSQAPGLSLIHI